MRNFMFGFLFAGFFAVTGIAFASTVTGGESFEDVWTAIVDLRTEIAELKTELTVESTREALEDQAVADSIEELRTRGVAAPVDGGVAHSEHFILGDASFE